MKKNILFTILISFLTIGLFATNRYVSLSGSNTAPYTSLATAANDIQTAIGASTAGDVILVDDGTYVLTTYISITSGITVKSINGAAAVTIDGNNATKCFEINNASAVLDGFTIINGYNPASFGGGVNIKNGGTVQNCIITDNQARDGGGIALDDAGLIQYCIIKNNLASDNGTSGYGGGIRLLNGGEVKNCLITENTSVKDGGGINIWNAGNVYNCTLTKNKAPYGGGIRTRNLSIIKNTIIYYNTLLDGTTLNNYEVNGAGYHYYNCCTTPALSGSYSTNCISSVPSFVSITGGSEDYHIQAGSLCIDVGLNLSWMNTAFDLDLNARIYNTIVDIGCYEYFPVIVDDDEDGVANEDDDFPDDPERAFINYFPAEGYGSLAYEDLWPAKGDYDFNDVVVDYRFATVTNADNFVVDITATFVAKASGAGLHNGFGFNLPLADNGLNSDLTVTGSDIQETYITLDGNGLEDGQTYPTIIVFDNIFNLLPHPQIGLGVNTEEWTPFVPFDTITLLLTPVQDTYDANDFSLIEWNPFIIVNKNRDVEVHLKDKPPTDLADPGLFGNVDDDSDPGSGRYYVTTNNLPWAIDVPSSFDWPKEKVDISWTYHYFVQWAESLGTTYTDWYEDLPGYRHDPNIYHVP